MWYSSGSCDNLVLIENNELISASFAPAALTKESIMPPIRNDWAKVLAPEYNKPYYRKLFDFVGKEYSTHTIYPPGDDIFNAFHLTPLKDVKCVIIGQDPYHGPGQAHGLSFSVKPGVDIPPSLINIYKELHDDVGCYIPNNGYLVKWAEQGGFALKCSFDCTCPSGCLPPGHGLGRIYRRGNPRRQQAKSTNRIFVVGKLCAEKSSYVGQSKSFDFESASSITTLRLPWILWL